MPKKKLTEPLRKHFKIPIYEAELYLRIADDIETERKALSGVFGVEPVNDYEALCSWNSTGHFGLFFERASLRPNIIAHEVFHLTHRILEWTSANFDADHHETAALLCGYLTELVYKEALVLPPFPVMKPKP